ncbi:hypothetical protein [Hyalangium versicolor]|uniref:hypothetical protein n=1 Tax=Hyalangium versicolor TaxID=2861190 RepID=UPI001CCE2705|nr:hypothetical protein [Hyalangium versicolor]
MGWVKTIGLASSLGPLIPACAAFRAGVARPSEAPDAETFFPGDEEPGTVSIHALPAATFGFSGVGRLIALFTEALADLATREDLGALDAQAGLYVALPDPQERGFTTGKEPDDEDPETPEERVAALGARVVEGAFSASGQPWRGTPARLFHGGNAAFAQALAAAGEDLEHRRVTAALVCAVDSLASPETLNFLRDEGLLKTEDHPTGLIPGEAAVALLLSPASASRKAEQSTPVFLRSVALDADPHPLGAERPTDAQPLADCVISALGPLAPQAHPPLLVSDHDGQHWRGHEWGMLQVQLHSREQRLAESSAWMPAQSFGHTGVASGGLGAAVALRAFHRGYAPAPSIIVLSSSDTGERAAIHFSSEEPSAPGRPRR